MSGFARGVGRRPASGAAWGVLVASGVLEAVWATALHASAGFSRPGPTALFLVTVAASTVGLGWAMRSIPTGTAYAVWTGIGSVLTVSWAVATGAEPLNPLKAVFLVGILGCVVGLKRAEGLEPITAGRER